MEVIRKNLREAQLIGQRFKLMPNQPLVQPLILPQLLPKKPKQPLVEEDF